MADTIIVNKLPALTWNRLGVNGTALSWDRENAAVQEEKRIAVPEEQEQTVHLAVTGTAAYGEKSVQVMAGKNSTVTVYQDLRAEKNLQVTTRIMAAEGARVRLVQLMGTEPNARLYSQLAGVCGKKAQIQLFQILLGQGDVYGDSTFTLAGEFSALQAEIGYLGQKAQVIDLGMSVDHRGRGTVSRINAAGALKDSSKKIFRGTIDFKTGCTGAVGSEQETVLMLGEDAVNKTVPLILCAEENVEGNHGATIGELDRDTLFYFESRGIGRAQAENIMARAAIERLTAQIGDQNAEEWVARTMEEVLRDGQGI